MRINATCINCGSVHHSATMFRIDMPDRGKGKFAYICDTCGKRNDYYDSNRNLITLGNQGRMYYGIELETVCSTMEFRGRMFNYNFIATNDSSLNDNFYATDSNGNEFPHYSGGTSCEYVSAKNRGLKRFAKQIQTIDEYVARGDVLIDDSCGTHTHISVNEMRNEYGQFEYMDYVRRFIHSLFIPVQRVMDSNPWKTAVFFGRGFTGTTSTGRGGSGYAPRFTLDYKPTNSHSCRYAWVNLTNDSNIEFRLNKFTSYEQYMRCLKLESLWAEWIYDEFCVPFTSMNREQRKARALAIGERIAQSLRDEFETLV